MLRISVAHHNASASTSRAWGSAALPAAKTAEMFFDFRELVSYISQFMTLNPGDVVLAGTAAPKAGASVQAGDTFEVEIAGVGTLRNPVVARPAMTTLPPPFKRQ